MSKKVFYIISLSILYLLSTIKESNALELSHTFFSINKDTVINLITKDTIFEESFPKDSIIKKNLNSFKKNWVTTEPLDSDSAALISEKLLSENPIFLEYWDNTQVFTYENVTYADLPTKIEIPLVQKGEKFQMTWYGNLNFKYGWRWGNLFGKSHSLWRKVSRKRKFFSSKLIWRCFRCANCRTNCAAL